LDTKEKFDEFFTNNTPLLKKEEYFDFIWLNLETPVVTELNECQYSEKSIKFCSKNTFLPWIKDLWFNIFALANNHSMDWWINWHNATIKSLEDIWIDYFWSIKHWNYLDKTYSFTWIVRDTPFSWHSYDFTIYWDRHLNEYCEELKVDKELWYNNFVVTHWWTEYQFMAHSKTQENLAKKLVDCWADLIIWMHPHVIQDYEYYNWKLILYSLGNFLFDQDWSENTQKWIWVFIEYKQNWETKFESFERNVSV
jgi:poly-gamma-glutamate synthesis protein (capsule biosynthesis protein)